MSFKYVSIIVVSSVMLCGCTNNQNAITNVDDTKKVITESDAIDINKSIEESNSAGIHENATLQQENIKECNEIVTTNAKEYDIKNKDNEIKNIENESNAIVRTVKITNGSNGQSTMIDSVDDVKKVSDLIQRLGAKEYTGGQYTGWKYRFTLFDEQGNEIAVYTFSGNKYSVKDNSSDVKYYITDDDDTYRQLMGIADNAK